MKRRLRKTAKLAELERLQDRGTRLSPRSQRQSQETFHWIRLGVGFTLSPWDDSRLRWFSLAYFTELERPPQTPHYHLCLFWRNGFFRPSIRFPHLHDRRYVGGHSFGSQSLPA